MDEELRRYDAIRPYEPEELPAAFDRLLADPQFRAVLAYAMPGVPFEALAEKMRSCKTCLEFQVEFCHKFLDDLLSKASTGCSMDCSALRKQGRYTFVSNHRDIVLDSALLALQLIDAGFGTTCEIAIGDNLLAAQWIKDLVKLNKSFIVERSASPREMLAGSKRMAEYMHYVIGRKHDNIWIAQREGRAKDSDDRTQPAVLKMMAMGGEGSAAERLLQMHIVPLAISYEYDPCDYLKAKEFQLKRDNPGWKKTKADDVLSMKTGIVGFKGRIHYHCSPCIDEWLGGLDPAMPKGRLFDAVARRIDAGIHSGYRLYPCNYVAADMVKYGGSLSARYTEREKAVFVDYVEGQVAKVDLPDRDDGFIRERILTMYANPAINKLEVGMETKDEE